MKSKRFVVVFIVVLVSMLLFTSVSVFSLTNMARENTKEINTMLAYRIYDMISSKLSEPMTVSKTMSCDNFVIEMLKNEDNYSEDEMIEIFRKYLNKIKSQYDYDAANIISEKSRRYYTDKGLNKVIDVENDDHDIWYKNFIDRNEKYYLNVDVDEVNQDQWTIFVDVRIEDENDVLLGVCSVGLRMTQIQKIFSDAQNEYGVKVNFVDKDGLVQVDIDDVNIENTYIDISRSGSDANSDNVFVSDENGQMTVSKYLDALGWYLVLRSDSMGINNQFRNSIVLNAGMSVVIAVIVLNVIVIVYRRSDRKEEVADRLSKQLSSTADIYISMHEINFLNDTFSEVQNNKAEAAAMIGETRNNCQQMIRMIMTRFSDETTRDSILDFVDFSKLDGRLKDVNTVTTEFLSADEKWRRARYIVSERTPEGKVAQAMYLIEDIDAEKRDRDLTLETLRSMNEQISSIANIYFSMYDIDLNNNTFSEIKTSVKKVSELIGPHVENVQQSMYDVMNAMSDITTRASIHDFVDFSTLNDRLSDKDTITEEFLSYRQVWSRARFVVSKRNPDGTIAHVMYLVEGIDEEKRSRDKLTEDAKTLNYRISSISNIYLTAHEIDLANDTFTQMKSDSSLVNSILTETHENARAAFRKIMETVTDESYRDNVLRFTDLDTLGRRLRNKNTITIEYLNTDKQWRRGRFIASRRDEHGKLTHVLWLSEDIDAEKRERDKLIDISERAFAASEAKSLFLSNMTNEISAPIKAVLEANDIILQGSADAQITECSEKIRTEGTALLGMINDILDFSMMEAGKVDIIPGDYDLLKVIDELVGAIKPKADAKGLGFVTDIGSGIPHLLRGDSKRIRQILNNLLTNAVQFTERGAVTLSVDCVKIPDDPEHLMLRAAVMDTGIGMKPEELQRLFPGVDRDSEGTSLGIEITQKLLRMMDSSLEVESVYELGSKFSFELRQTAVSRE